MPKKSGSKAVLYEDAAQLAGSEERLRSGVNSSTAANWKRRGVPWDIIGPILRERLSKRKFLIAESKALYDKASLIARPHQIQQRIERLFRRTEGRGKEWVALERLLDVFEPPINDEGKERERYWKVLRGGKQ